MENPTEVVDKAWLYSKFFLEEYVKEKSGKWLIFRTKDEIDELWVKIKNPYSHAIRGIEEFILF